MSIPNNSNQPKGSDAEPIKSLEASGPNSDAVKPGTLDSTVARMGEREFLDGSHYSGDMEDWSNGRKFIGDYISSDIKRHSDLQNPNLKAAVLDIGCANGGLLKSIEQWTDGKIDPYGIDADQDGKEVIKQAQEEVFVEESGFDPADRFKQMRMEDIANADAVGMPNQYDYVVWNVWDDFELGDERGRAFIDMATGATKDGGSTLLTFYESDERMNEKLDALKNHGIEFQLVKNSDRPERMAVIKKSPVKQVKKL